MTKRDSGSIEQEQPDKTNSTVAIGGIGATAMEFTEPEFTGDLAAHRM